MARGIASGFLRQVGSLGGFVAGLMLGAVIAPWVAGAMPSGSNRALVAVLVFFGVALTVGGLGEALGHALSGLAERYRLRVLDTALGAIFGVGITLLAVWLLAATFARSAGPALAAQIQSSRVLQVLDRSLPPAPDVLARLERTLGVNGLPRVFAGLEPAPAAPVAGPDAPAVNAVTAAGRAATVKILGEGWGGEVEGSGFVAGPGLVATNAHVVAGIDSPTVEDAAGSHRAQVVLFDPDLDFAVLRTVGLAAAPLPLDPNIEPRGTVGAALGYPGGGDFTASPAAILDRITATGRNIYDAGLVRRDIYELQALVRPGNSGGPLVAPDGSVIGVIFATSTVNGNLGYALTSAEVLPDFREAATSGSVSGGTCIAE
ncbi:MAG: Colicin production protein [Patescibacteria group bacterium]|nr:Colicin production protein [Patescibacteria group bacterium]